MNTTLMIMIILTELIKGKKNKKRNVLQSLTTRKMKDKRKIK